jgi:hypothetical protein
MGTVYTRRPATPKVGCGHVVARPVRPGLAVRRGTRALRRPDVVDAHRPPDLVRVGQPGGRCADRVHRRARAGPRRRRSAVLDRRRHLPHDQYARVRPSAVDPHGRPHAPAPVRGHGTSIGVQRVGHVRLLRRVRRAADRHHALDPDGERHRHGGERAGGLGGCLRAVVGGSAGRRGHVGDRGRPHRHAPERGRRRARGGRADRQCVARRLLGHPATLARGHGPGVERQLCPVQLRIAQLLRTSAEPGADRHRTDAHGGGAHALGVPARRRRTHGRGHERARRHAVRVCRV